MFASQRPRGHPLPYHPNSTGSVKHITFGCVISPSGAKGLVCQYCDRYGSDQEASVHANSIAFLEKDKLIPIVNLHPYT
jgi:hypothetical protein